MRIARLNALLKTSNICGVCFDSRLLKEGDLFFALKGAHFDGHLFLEEAARKGAAGAVVSKEYRGNNFGLKLFYVENVTAYLQSLAKDVFKENPPLVIGVTGSVGKTTTKEFIAQILEGKYRVAKTLGNANSQVGFPAGILNGNGLEEIFVAEMGMEGHGEILNLVDICPPDIAVITKIGLSHSLFFPNGREDIAQAKAEIFSHPRTKAVFMHEETKQYRAMQHPHILTPASDIPFVDLPSHFYENFMLAVEVARYLNMSLEEIQARIPYLRGYKYRFEKVERFKTLFINDSYNASMESTNAALQNLPKPKEGGKTVLVFGEMRWLGKFTDESHRLVGETALKNNVDHLLYLGNECAAMLEVFKKANRPVEQFTDFALLKSRLFDLILPNDVVLIKGSNPHALWRLLE